MSTELPTSDAPLGDKQLEPAELGGAATTGELDLTDALGNNTSGAANADEPTRFFCWQNFLVAIPNVLIPSLYG